MSLNHSSTKKPETIVLAFAEVKGKYLHYQALELKSITASLDRNDLAGRIAVLENSAVDFKKLYDTLHSQIGKYVTMLHYSGHSSAEGLHGSHLNYVKIIDAKSLSKLIGAQRKIRFVFLNSCNSKAVADELIKVGVPYVVATNGPVDDLQASVVAGKFYSTLASGKTIVESFELTKLYLNDGTFKPQYTKEGRSMGEPDHDSQNYYWELFENPKVTDLEKKWNLFIDDSIEAADNKKTFHVKPILHRWSITISVAVTFFVFVFIYTIYPDLLITNKNPILIEKNKNDSTNSNSKDVDKTDKKHDPYGNSPIKSSTRNDLVLIGIVTDGQTSELLDNVNVTVNGVTAITKSGNFQMRLQNALKDYNGKDLTLNYVLKKKGYENGWSSETISVNNEVSPHLNNLNLKKQTDSL